MPSAPYETYASDRATNPMGIAGFVCSLLGLLTGGHLLSPVGLVLSLVALGRRPRGFAIAGVVIGFLGTCGWALVLVVVLAAVGIGVGVAFMGMFLFTQAERIELTSDMAKIAMQAEQYKEENRGVTPASLTVLTLDPSTLNDPWGKPYRLELRDEDPGFDIVSDGEDGVTGTADDVRLSALDKYWEKAGEDFQQQMEDFDKRRKFKVKMSDRDRPPVDVTVTPSETDPK